MKKNIILLTFVLSTLFSCEDDEIINKAIILADLNNYSISALAIDKANGLWIGTDTGLFKAVASGYQMVDIKTDAPVTALAFEDINNTLWVGTGDGISRLSLAGNKIFADTIANDSISNKNINSVYVDPNSVKWFGTEFGITRNRSLKWQKEKFKKNLSGTITPLALETIGVNSIASWDGDYFFATNGQSLYRTSNWDESVNAFTGATQWYNPYNGFAITDTMYVIFIDSNGQQWMGGRKGIQVHAGHVPTEQNTSFYDELVNPFVHCISEAPDGKIWAGTEYGISVYDGTSWSALSVNLPNKYITAIAFDKNGVTWIGTKKGLVSIN
jgi:ligand-binding sensor domain-containing protein